MTLTPKQEAFCHAYHQTGNASEAYRRAGYSGGSLKTIHEAASRLLRNSKVLARVTELQARAAKKHDVTVDGLTDELDKALAKAMAEPKGASAAVSAIMAKGKLHGLVVDKKEVTSKRDAADFTDEELGEIARLGRARTPEATGGAQEPGGLH